MTKAIILLLLSIFIFGCKKEQAAPVAVPVQGTVSHEKMEALFNEVSKVKYFKDMQYFHLRDTAYAKKIDTTTDIIGKYRFKILKHYGFTYEALRDSSLMSLRDYKIKKARFFSYLRMRPILPRYSRKDTLVPLNTSKQIIDSLNKYDYENFYTAVDKTWPKYKINKEITLNHKRYKESFNDEDNHEYFFSKPVFSEDNNFAFIEVQHCRLTGTHYLFKYKNGKWMLEKEMETWIS